MRIKITELQQQSGLSDTEFAKLLWPDAPEESRRVSLAKVKKGLAVGIKFTQLRDLCEQFATSNVYNLIDVEP